jgi:cellulose synthase/poly-beta-1,6-N-acetylglucosamine synthase-like glycosyltransferase
MNDVVPECLGSIWQTYPADIYVLDDSTDLEKRRIVDRIAWEKGYRVLRREHRQGFKAGAVNNWIKVYGQEYDYIVLLDADSYIPSDWVEEALKYSEHSSNSNIAIFQGLINIWNLSNRFVRTLAPLHV